MTDVRGFVAFAIGAIGAYYLFGKRRMRPNITLNAEMFLVAAEEDIEAARILSRSNNRLASFHVQQAAEKLLKGVAMEHGVDPVKGHQMRGSWKRIEDEPMRAILPDFDHLEKYATAFRYPKKNFPALTRGMSREEIDRELETIEAAIDLARERYGRNVTG